jgi:hypothetical protein
VAESRVSVEVGLTNVSSEPGNEVVIDYPSNYDAVTERAAAAIVTTPAELPVVTLGDRAPPM